MIKKLVLLASFLLVSLTFVQSTFALSTYVGVKILNLTDDPSYSCAGLSTGDVDNPVTLDFNETAYDYRGRIRALSSIVGAGYPDQYPIYFELSYASNGTIIWSGNSTEDRDYKIGDVIQLPNTVDLNLGTDYNLFFDIDAVMIYLPLSNIGDFEASLLDLYWTVGKIGTAVQNEVIQWSYDISGSDKCKFNDYGITTSSGNSMFYIGNNKSVDFSTCNGDIVSQNCDNEGLLGFSPNSGYFGIGDNLVYNNLYQPTVGNINIGFTFN